MGSGTITNAGLAIDGRTYAARYEGIIREAAALYRVDASLIRSVMQAESSFDPSAVSRAGAMGLMQLMPAIESPT